MYERDSEKERPYLYLNSPLPQISECDSSLPSYWARTVQEHTVSSTRLSTYLGECTISKCVFATTHLHLQISITYKMLLKKKKIHDIQCILQVVSHSLCVCVHAVHVLWERTSKKFCSRPLVPSASDRAEMQIRCSQIIHHACSLH